MPIPFMNNDWKEESFKRHCIGQNLILSLLPRKCFYSGRLLWFKYSYKVTAMWTGPGTPVFEDRWVDKNEYLLKKIKGDL
jgi:hypothetical protein